MTPDNLFRYVGLYLLLVISFYFIFTLFFYFYTFFSRFNFQEREYAGLEAVQFALRKCSLFLLLQSPAFFPIYLPLGNSSLEQLLNPLFLLIRVGTWRFLFKHLTPADILDHLLRTGTSLSREGNVCNLIRGSEVNRVK